MPRKPLPISGFTIQDRKSELDLSESDIKFYAPLGYAISRIASLEVRMDDFIFDVRQIAPQPCLRLAPRYPQRWREKTDFIIGCFVIFPPLRWIGDVDGRLDLIGIQYTLDEISDFRNLLVHGSFYYFEDRHGHVSYEVERYVRQSAVELGGAKETFKNLWNRMHLGFVEHMLAR